MTTLEIVLLILGIAIFVLSFFVFGGNSRQDLTEIREEVKEEVRQAVNVQMAEAGRRWEDTLRESGGCCEQYGTGTIQGFQRKDYGGQ